MCVCVHVCVQTDMLNSWPRFYWSSVTRKAVKSLAPRVQKTGSHIPGKLLAATVFRCLFRASIEYMEEGQPP